MNKNFLIFGLLFLVMISGVSATLTDGLVSYWNFEDNGNDELGLNNLTITGATYTTGKTNRGILFTNLGDKAQINSNFNWGGINTTSTGMTMCGWYNSTDSVTTYQRVALFSKNTGAYYYGLQIRNEFGGNFTGWFNANAGEDFVGTGITKGNTNFNFICLVYNSTGMHSYTNANFIQTDSTYASTQSFTPTQLNLGQNTIETSEQFKGMIDAFGFWNRTLSSTEITELYNEGAGLQYPFVTNFTITTNLADYNITMVSNETLNYESSATTYTTELNLTDERLWNITLVANSILYDNLTFTNYNISLNGSLTTAFTLKNANISFTANEIITNNNIYDFNISLGNGTTLTDSNSSHMITYGYYNLTFIKSPYYNLTLTNQLISTDTTIDFDNVYDSLLNVSKYLLPGNTTLNNVSGWVYNAANDYNVSFSSASYTTTVNLLKDLTYTVYVAPQSIYSGNTSTISPTSSTYNHTIYSYQTSSIYITFYDESNNSILTSATISLDVIADSYSYNTTTTNGTIYLYNLTPKDYILRYSATGYTERLYYVTVAATEYYVLNLYLEQNTTTGYQDIDFTVRDLNDNNLEGAFVKALKYDSTTGNYILTEQCKTNFLGTCSMNLLYNSEFYKFQVQYEDETKLTTNPTYITAASYVFRIDIGDQFGSDYYNYLDIDASLVFNTNTSSFRLTYNDANSLASNFCVYVYAFSDGDKTLEASSCSQTSSGTVLVPITVVNGTLYTAYAYYNTPQVFLIAASYESPTQPVDKDLGIFLQILLTLTFALLSIKFIEFVGVSISLSLIIGKIMELHSLPWAAIWGVMIVSLVLMSYLKRDK